MAKLDFIATVDIIMNDTAWFSDVVLPEASYLERYDPLSIMGDRAFIRQPVIEPQGEAKSALWIYKQLGERLGISDFFQYKDEEDYLRQQLAPLGRLLEEVRATGYAELPARRMREVFTLEHTQRQDRTQVLHAGQRLASPASPPGRSRPRPQPGQFYLLTGKGARQTQFGTQNNQLLHKYDDEPRLWMNTQTAAEPGLARQRHGGSHQRGWARSTSGCWPPRPFARTACT